MESDLFLQNYNSSDRKIAGEFLTNWLPFLTEGLCKGCSGVLRDRIRSLDSGNAPQSEGEGESFVGAGSGEEYVSGLSEVCDRIEALGWDIEEEQESIKGMSWADMAQQEELEKEGTKNLEGEMGEVKLKKRNELPREERERIRFTGVKRKKDFVCLERLDRTRRTVNILEGLELHTGVYSSAEQKRIVDFVYDLQEKGRNGELGEHTYSEPRKWMRGKGRVTIQFGCCYNYAEKNGIPPGIIRHVNADPIPHLFKVMIRRLIGWHVLPTYCVPDSCIVNIYEPGDCIPPHIDNHDFVRPFCTVSFLSECNIVFGSNLKIAGPGEFIGSTSISLPVGSVLVLNGNGADIAKHCVPAVPYKRISITFRKMDKTKWPHRFKLEPDLQNIKPYVLNAGIESQVENKEKEPSVESGIIRWNPSGRLEPDLQNIMPYDLSAGIESHHENKEKEASVEIRTMRKKPIGRLNRAKIKSLHFDEAEELMERSLRSGSMNDNGSNSVGNKVSNERRIQMQQRHANNNLDIDNDSFIRRRSNWDSRHPKGRIRTFENQRVW